MSSIIILEQAQIYPRIKGAYAAFEKDPEAMSVSACKARMSHLEKTWSTYDQNNMLLLNHKDYPTLGDQTYIKNDHFSQVEEFYIQNMCKFQTYIDQNLPNNQNSEPQTQLRPHIVTLDNERLPPLNIPHFSGDYTTWEAFRDMFTSSVINRIIQM